MQNIFEFEFKFHNVGQGLFYTGNIKSKISKSNFIFIYDCGSENKKIISLAIKRFYNDLRFNNQSNGNDYKKIKINLLVISHLHYDHISGLETLLKYFDIEDVVMPYFSIEDRFLIALNSTSNQTWFYNFLYDPVRYLFERGIERIFLINGGGSNNENKPLKEYHEDDKLINNLNDDKNYEEITKAENWQDFTTQGKLYHKTHNGYLIYKIWLFRFFNYKNLKSINDINFMKKCFRIFFENLKNSKDVEKLELLDCLNKKQKLRAIFKEKNIIKELKKCYNKLKTILNNDFNNTSLIMFHGPIKNSHINNIYFYTKQNCLCDLFCPCKRFNICHKSFMSSSIFGHFLTGDINLNFSYEDIKNHYQKHLGEIISTQIPHHGSIKNWNKNILSDFKGCKLWVISSGVKNKYGHPSFEVIKDLSFNYNSGYCVWVNETNYLLIKGHRCY